MRSPEVPAASGELPFRSSELAHYGTIFRSLFGESVPALVTTPEVAPFTRAVATCAGVAEVWPARWTATAPATCGVVYEVIERVAIDRCCSRELTPWGTAVMYTQSNAR
jgi:hypothetical protein